MVRSEAARAKVNLTLHVLGRRADGLHDLESLVAFADLADHLTLDEDAPLGLTVTGPTAQVSGPADDNLVTRAAHALAAEVPGLRLGSFQLSKHLPVAAGIGGGSADAAAALRLLAAANGLDADDARVMAAARAVGADVPVCMAQQARVMRGAGENLGTVLQLPAIHAVLVNPGVPVATAQVFAALGLAVGQNNARRPETVADAPDAHAPGAFATMPDATALFRILAASRNDLEAPAMALVPEIGAVLDALGHQHRCQIARMSGSGATCYGLFPTMSSAFQAVRTLRRLNSHWWVQPAIIG